MVGLVFGWRLFDLQILNHETYYNEAKAFKKMLPHKQNCNINEMEKSRKNGGEISAKLSDASSGNKAPVSLRWLQEKKRSKHSTQTRKDDLQKNEVSTEKAKTEATKDKKSESASEKK